MDAEDFVLDFDSSLKVKRATLAITSATENFNHEAAWLKQKILDEKRAAISSHINTALVAAGYDFQNSVLHRQNMVAEFEASHGHECRRGECEMVSLKPKTLYTCVCPHEDNDDERTVTHVASGAVYICKLTGAIHVCTQTMCQYQAPAERGTVICELTGLDLGPYLVYEKEYSDGRCFQDSSKKRTWTRVYSADTGRLAHNAQLFEQLRPDNIRLMQQQRESIAKLVQTKMSVTQQVKRPMLLPPPECVFVDGPAGEKIALPAPPSIEPGAIEPVRLLTDRKQRRPRRPEPAAREEAPFKFTPGCVPRHNDAVLEQFKSCVARMFATLEAAYSLRRRRAELEAEVEIAARKMTDACRIEIRNNGSCAAAPTFNKLCEIFNANSAHCFVGMEQMLALESWPPWKSGEFKRARCEALPRRMLQAWNVITKSSEFYKPYLYMRIDSTLMYEVISGIELDVCVFSHKPGGPLFAKNACASGGGGGEAHTPKCGHKGATLTLIQRDQVLHDIINVEGIITRLSLTDNALLSKRITILQFYVSLFENGIPLSEVTNLCVKF